MPIDDREFQNLKERFAVHEAACTEQKKNMNEHLQAVKVAVDSVDVKISAAENRTNNTITSSCKRLEEKIDRLKNTEIAPLASSVDGLSSSVGEIETQRSMVTGGWKLLMWVGGGVFVLMQLAQLYLAWKK